MILRGPKIRAEIVMQTGDSIKKKFRVEGDKVVIRKPNDRLKDVGWMPKFYRDSIVKERKGRILKSRQEKVVVRYGALECLRFQDNDTKIPNVDEETIKRIFRANVIEAAGKSLLNLKIPWYVTLLLFMTFALTIIKFLMDLGIGF